MSGPFANLPLSIHRSVAAMGIALVVFLGVLSVRPDLHEAFCRHAEPASACGHQHAPDADRPASDDGTGGCVISLFAHGHVLAALVLVLLFAIAAVRAAAFAGFDSVALPAPTYRWPHGCGPPLV